MKYGPFLRFRFASQWRRLGHSVCGIGGFGPRRLSNWVSGPVHPQGADEPMSGLRFQSWLFPFPLIGLAE